MQLRQTLTLTLSLFERERGNFDGTASGSPNRDPRRVRSSQVVSKSHGGLLSRLSWCESKSGSQFQGVMSAADGLPRKEEDAGASPATLTISGRQADTSWLHLSRKQDRLKPEVGALPTPSAILAVCQHLTATLNERKSYATCYPLPKPVARSQEL